jgi:hypothetical protein
MDSLPFDVTPTLVRWGFRLAALGFVWGLITLVRRAFRYTPPVSLSETDLAALRQETRHYDAWATVLAVIIGAAVAFGCWAGCRYAAEELERAMPPHHFLFRSTSGKLSNDGLWAIPAAVLGLVTAIRVHAFGVRLLFGRTGFLAWQFVTNAKWGVNQQRLNRVFTALFAPGSLILALLFLDMYTRVEEDQFVTNGVFSLQEESRPYTDIVAIVITTHARDRNGRESHAPRLHVVFIDGSEWFAFPPQDYMPLIEFLERKTGKRLQEVRHVEDLARP